MKITINVSEVRPTVCGKCGKKKVLFRHHKGNDKRLSSYNRKIYKNYYKYLDCVSLCNRCHMIIHYIYEPIVQEWSDWSGAGAWKLRDKLIGVCDMWLISTKPNPTVPRIYKNAWAKSFQEWRRTHRHRSTKGK